MFCVLNVELRGVTWEVLFAQLLSSYGLVCFHLDSKAEETQLDSTVFLRKLLSFVVLSLTVWNAQAVVIGLVSLH